MVDEEDYEDSEDYEDEDERGKSVYNVFGAISIFSFISIIFVFISAMIIIGTNNYAVSEIYNFSEQFKDDGYIPESIFNTIDDTAESLPNVLPYLDLFWLASFISFVGSILVYSYFSKRESYFSILSFLLVGILIILFVGGIFIQLTNWFKDEILIVFPTILDLMPKFSFYLNNAGIINAVLVLICLVVNFIDLDLNKYFQRKDKEDLGGEL